jgi:predicted methyltransferase
MGEVKLFNGDCLDVLKSFQDNSIDSLITDPPAGISFMGKSWDSGDNFIENMTEIYKECLRVMKSGAHGLVWALPRTSHWTATALESAGFEVRDVITHLFGSGFPKSLNISKAIDKMGLDSGQYQGYGTALKPAAEFWLLVRKPLSEKTVAQNVLKHGCGGLNIDKSRIYATNKSWENYQNLCGLCVDHVEKNVKHIPQVKKECIVAENVDMKDLESQHGIAQESTTIEGTGCLEKTSTENINVNLNTCIYGKNTTAQSQKDISSTTLMKTKKTTGLKTCSLCGREITLDCTIKENQSGRFPANLVLSHNEDCECVGNKEVKTSSLLTTHKISEAEKITMSGKHYDRSPNKDYGVGGTEKVQNWQCTEGCAVKMLGEPSRFFYSAKVSPSERNAGLENIKNGHPTVKPQKLMQYLVKLITPPKGVVLDCFMGSGSTGLAANTLGFSFMGIEKEKDYFEIAEKRINYKKEQTELDI